MVVALILLLVAVGSVLFHFLSPWWWTPIASNWGYIDTTIIITFWITGVVFIAIVVFMAYCVWKFKEGSQAEYKPENKKLEVWLTVLTSIGVAGMLAPGLIVWNDFRPRRRDRIRGGRPAMAVELPPSGRGWRSG
jgi:cytochrome c oxidase subunit 2